METNPQFRAARAADVTALTALVESAYRGQSSRAGWTTEADLLDGQRTDDEDVAEAIGASQSLVVIAEEGGELVGCCNVRRLPDATGYFGMFAVRPQLQGRGTGRALVAQAEQMARENWGCTVMKIQVIKQRDELIAWYERLGYRRTGESVPFPYGNTRFGIPKRQDLEFAVLTKSI
jgi:ribosomal protein S18 acetylase RimI-like enzyme